MGTELTQAGDYPKAANGLTLPLRTFLGSQALMEHRALLGLELEVVSRKLDRYGWDKEQGSVVQNRLISDWMDALQDYPLTEVQEAIKACLDEKPGRTPNERDVRLKILTARERFLLINRRRTAAPDPERRPVTAEEAARIMAEYGYAPKRFGS